MDGQTIERTNDERVSEYIWMFKLGTCNYTCIPIYQSDYRSIKIKSLKVKNKS